MADKKQRRRLAKDRVIQQMGDHAPRRLPKSERRRIASDVVDGELQNMIVLAADIRRSTFVMKEAVDFGAFADTLNQFVSEIGKFVRKHDGWWDKFTGDGYLAYWMFDAWEDTRRVNEMIAILDACHLMVEVFEHQVLDALRANSRNFPHDVGLSLGLDAGPTYLVEIANDLTIVGPSVVGAVRMVSNAAPGEIIANNYLGEYLLRHRDCCFAQTISDIERQVRMTKEYVQGQEVYTLKLLGPAARGETPPTH